MALWKRRERLGHFIWSEDDRNRIAKEKIQRMKYTVIRAHNIWQITFTKQVADYCRESGHWSCWFIFFCFFFSHQLCLLSLGRFSSCGCNPGMEEFLVRPEPHESMQLQFYWSQGWNPATRPDYCQRNDGQRSDSLTSSAFYRYYRRSYCCSVYRMLSVLESTVDFVKIDVFLPFLFRFFFFFF